MADQADTETSGAREAGMFSDTIYASCPICYGSRVVFGAPCITCADPDPVIARRALERLTLDQIAFLRAFGHTLAQQPITQAEDDAHRCELYVEEGDGTYDEEADIWIVPNTKIWFASGMSRFGPCGQARFIRYNPLGLLLRECLMAGADVNVRHENAFPPT